MNVAINGTLYPLGENSGGDIYSTEETRIGTWIDGKPIYRLVIKDNSGIGSLNVGVLIFPNFTTTYHVDQVIKMDGVLNSAGTSQQIKIPSNATDWSFTSFIWEGSISMKITGAAWALNKPFILILEYTKTTDPAPASLAAFDISISKNDAFALNSMLPTTSTISNFAIPAATTAATNAEMEIPNEEV